MKSLMKSMQDYQMMNNESAFFAHNVQMPMLHGVNRDLLGSEFLIYNFLYVILPNFWAYMAGYALKIAIGIISFILLARDVYKEKYDEYRPILVVIATAFGLIPVFPTYGLAFTSVPLIIWLLRRLYYTEELKKRVGEFMEMEQRSCSMEVMTPEYVARCMQISIDAAAEALELLKIMQFNKICQ